LTGLHLAIEPGGQDQAGIEVIGFHHLEQLVTIIDDHNVDAVELESLGGDDRGSLVDDAEPGLWIEQAAEHSPDDDGHQHGKHQRPQDQWDRGPILRSFRRTRQT